MNLDEDDHPPDDIHVVFTATKVSNPRLDPALLLPQMIQGCIGEASGQYEVESKAHERN
jgi:hypothetical protein